MNYNMISYVLGSLLRIEGILMSIPMVLAFVYGESAAQKAFLITVVVCLALGTLIRHKEPENKSIYGREGFVVVALSWIVMSLFGALPFYLSGAINGFINCFFETVSGFTTTGASILTEIEGLPMSILFWRSFTHWIGGMGILVFMLAILPMGDERSMYLMKAEAPGPMVSKLVPKVKSTAKLLYKIYIALTVIEMVLLLLGGMPLFDSVVNSFSTAGTGGFAILNSSIAGYNNAYYEYVITIFMLLFGVNFNLYYLMILRDFKSIWKNEELRYYVVIVVACIVLITGNIYSMYPTFESAFRHAAFQVAAIVTTTGFATANFDLWPEFSKTLIFCLTILGACAGSTGGGIKVSRLIILLKLAYREIRHIVHPRSVNLIK
ncbi:MAG: TrkH family potassium uptake protein, partial [Anaerotignum sp.]|nr:TrkH family potassium uptake protein [Anaerotignum sp.]